MAVLILFLVLLLLAAASAFGRTHDSRHEEFTVGRLLHGSWSQRLDGTAR